MSLINEIQQIHLFNEKAEKLLNSDFLKQLLKRGSISYTLSAKVDEPVQIEAFSSSETNRDAFVLTFRFFMQDRESSSFNNMSHTYSRLNIDQTLKDRFNAIRDNLNNYLDQNPKISITYNKVVINRRKILMTIIYGGLSHTDPRHRPLYNQWKNNPMIFPLIMVEFDTILAQTLQFIRTAFNLNNQVLQILQGQ